jgi:DNA-binding PadR family transcriptional regulator
MQSIDYALKKLVDNGIVDPKVAVHYAGDRKSFETSLGL